MANIEDLYLPYPDFKLQEIIDPEQFDINNEYTVIKMNEVLEVVNQIINSSVDGQSGADLINLTPITGFVSNKLQAFLEEVVSILQSADGSSRIGTPVLEGLPGSTVAQQLVSIKEQLVGHIHDDRYYTKQDTYARGEFALQKFNPTVETFIATEGQTVFFLTKGTYTRGKNHLEITVGGVEQTVGLYAGNSVLETGSNAFMLTEGVPAGTKVIAQFYAGDIPIQLGTGHGGSHEVGAYDELDVTKLRNYNLIPTTEQVNLVTARSAQTIHSIDYLNGDGIDETVQFQKMLDDGVGKSVHISKPLSKYKLGIINIPSNSNIFIQQGTTLEITLGALPLSYNAWVNLVEKENVFISGYGVNFNMIKSDYPVGGEWNHCFRILGCKNVFIEGVGANNSGGDGFYIGMQYIEGSKQNENVTLHEVRADNNARQGISLCTGKNMALIRPTCTNTIGSSPQAGIDLEIEGPNPVCENWTVVSPYTAGNKGAGVAFNPSKIVNTGKHVNISITNHKDVGSNFGFHAFGGVAGSVGGVVSIKNPVYQDNVGGGLVCNDYDVNLPLIDVENPTVINCNTANTANSLFDSAIAVVRDASATSLNTHIGNMRVSKAIVVDSRTTKQTTSAVYSTDLKGSGVKKCFLIDPIQLDTKTVMLNIKGEWLLSDSNNILSYKDLGSTSVGFYNRNLVRHNLGATGMVTLTLASSIAIGTVVTFDVRTAQIFRVVPVITSKIHPVSTVAGKYIQSNVIGSRITLELVDVDVWLVRGIVGTWTVEA